LGVNHGAGSLTKAGLSWAAAISHAVQCTDCCPPVKQKNAKLVDVDSPSNQESNKSGQRKRTNGEFCLYAIDWKWSSARYDHNVLPRQQHPDLPIIHSLSEGAVF
jgi:hypothetical protein